MLEFSSIASFLQVNIAEKIDYYDLMEFELSSKLSTQTVALRKHKPVIDVNVIKFHESAIIFEMQRPRQTTIENGKIYTWNNSCQESTWIHNLPRLKVETLKIWGYKYVLELIELADFCENEVVMHFCTNIPSLEIVDKLAHTFNIIGMSGELKECINLPWFRELKTISTDIDFIPDEQLVQLTASELHLISYSNSSRLSSLSNQFIQQWSRKTRNIKSFRFMEETTTVTNKELLLNGLSYTKIVEGKIANAGLHLIAQNKDESCGTYPMGKNFEAYLIDREDCKLLVCVSDSKTFKICIAHEVTEVFIKCRDDSIVHIFSI